LTINQSNIDVCFITIEIKRNAVMKSLILNADKILNYKPEEQPFDFESIQGVSGTLFCFSGYIWDLRSIRYVLWLQRYSQQFESHGVSSVLVLPAHKQELSTFLMSIPQKINFTLIADPDNNLLRQYEMEKSGFVLVNNQQNVLKRWYANDALYLGVRRVLDFLQ